jgi:Na+(H+)/acetate symporter ActP
MIEKWFLGFSNLTMVDYSVLFASLAIMILIGFYAGRKEDSTHDFFLGGRGIPRWAATLSFVATEISAVTIIAVPATAYKENWAYLQLFIGSFLFFLRDAALGFRRAAHRGLPGRFPASRLGFKTHHLSFCPDRHPLYRLRRH